MRKKKFCTSPGFLSSSRETGLKLFNFPRYSSHLMKSNHEELITDIIKRGLVLDHCESPCEENFVPDKSAEITIMFNKMEEPKDFVTRLQVAKVMVSAYSASGRNRMRCLRKSKAELGSSVYKIVRQNVGHSAIKTTV